MKDETEFKIGDFVIHKYDDIQNKIDDIFEVLERTKSNYKDYYSLKLAIGVIGKNRKKKIVLETNYRLATQIEVKERKLKSIFNL
jgi:hypothetical protein